MDPNLVLDRILLHIPEHDIPVPRHLSEAARAFLATAGMAPRAKYPPAADKAAWRQAKAAWDERMLPMLEQALGDLPVPVTTHQIGACAVYEATPDHIADGMRDCIYIDIHGGALVFGAGKFAEVLTRLMASFLHCRVLGVDYRVPPEHPYPAALEDCLSVYRHALQTYDASHIVVGGVSAGGNLAAATILRARDEGLPLPAAAVLLTPEVDLTESGDTFFTHRDVDVALPGPLPETCQLYANGADLTDPYVSPLFADFTKGFPPTFLQSGTRDIYLSNTVRMHRALQQAGQKAELHVWEAMPHAGFGATSPEDGEMHAAIRDFLRREAGWAP